MEFEMIKVKSSNIKAIGWLENFKYKKNKRARNTLRIEFKSKSIYDYIGVSKKVFEEFISSNSFGKFFADKIRDNYLTIKRK